MYSWVKMNGTALCLTTAVAISLASVNINLIILIENHVNI